ncbi:uncharacterized protein SPAPADRAFT_61006 [Spathaspora passalidarum NRRL Y-27907]|uniref:Transmembrane protein n=1 Tax=Spathaspora passalidarum (strain NRRL Y-27907 / 11-Y1) TaxID=619300 RepID=G3AN60_SPAPN|nr:uncharacterized protein SPAPADRAFT_61006 [Spathaspora passalidarum NRRL Y-27907]EGW31903.1 hypothetical protein SPAPADRAFT_61006 [Spathaspora passalidarum NRRL Y-27907]
MSKETPSMSTSRDNPLFDKLNPQQIQASIKFYEADHELTHEERLKITQDLQYMVGKSNIVTLGATIAGSLSPTVYYRYIKKQVPAGARFIVYPGLSFFLGLGNLFLVNNMYGRYQFNQKQNEVHDPKLQRVWDSMDYRTLAIFYIYYLRSSADPNAIMKDPRSITREDIYGVKVDPNMAEKVNQPKDTYSEYATRWNEIRQEEVKHEQELPEIKKYDNDDIFDFDKPRTETSDQEDHQSAWDKIRSSSR